MSLNVNYVRCQYFDPNKVLLLYYKTLLLYCKTYEFVKKNNIIIMMHTILMVYFLVSYVCNITWLFQF